MIRKWLQLRRWRRSGKVSEAELAIVRALLSGQDPRFGKLFKQVEQAEGVERELANGGRGFVLKLPWTREDLLIFLDEQVRSEPLLVRDGCSGRLLRFTLVVQRGGFCGPLEGLAIDDGEWPLEWSIAEIVVDSEPGERLRLPRDDTKAMLPRLQEWLGGKRVVVGRQVSVHLFPPPSREQLRELEQRIECPLPAEYRQLLGIADGLDIDTLSLLGTKDAYRYGGPDPIESALVIASLGEDGVLGIPLDGRDGSVFLYEPGGAAGVNRTRWAPSLRDLIRSALGPNKKKSLADS